jgi:cytoskeletal protein CcmA (bactofilin family)
MSNPYDTLKERTSILGPTIQFKGELSADEDLIINGTIEGSITRMQRLTIGREGTVHANVDAQLVVITAPSVSIQEGAKFNGSVDMSEGSVAKDSGTSAAAGIRRPSSAA